MVMESGTNGAKTGEVEVVAEGALEEQEEQKGRNDLKVQQGTPT